MSLLASIAHWVFHQSPHKHHYRYVAEMDHEGNVHFAWRCVYLFCDAEIEDDH